MKKSLARNLRARSTEAEKLLWSKPRGRRLAGYKFKRQVPIAGYIVDFVALEPKLIVEIDGGQHSENEADRLRTRALEEFGFRVVRYWNNDVLSNLEGVLESLVHELRIPD